MSAILVVVLLSSVVLGALLGGAGVVCLTVHSPAEMAGHRSDAVS